MHRCFVGACFMLSMWKNVVAALPHRLIVVCLFGHVEYGAKDGACGFGHHGGSSGDHGQWENWHPHAELLWLSHDMTFPGEYLWMARISAMLFASVMQQVILIDVAYNWNRSWSIGWLFFVPCPMCQLGLCWFCVACKLKITTNNNPSCFRRTVMGGAVAVLLHQ